MKFKNIGLLLFIIIFGFSGLQAQSLSSESISKTGTTVAQFLKIGVSARSIAMGGAFVAVANDVSAIYLNSAGLAKNYGYEAMFTHTDWIANTDYDFGAVSFNMPGYGALGIMVAAFSSGEMPVRTVEEPDGTGELFTTNDLLIGLAYSRNLTTNFSIGFTGKYIYQQIWHMSSSSMAIDVGLLFQTPFWGINLGASIQNFGPKMRLDGRDTKFATDPDPRNTGNVFVVNSQYEMQHYDLPLTFQVGVSKDIFKTERNRLTVAVDAITPKDNYESVNAGLEYGWNELVFLRGGYNSLFLDDSEYGFAGGFGLNLRLGGTLKMQMDYAYADLGRLENAQRFTLSIKF